MSRLPYQIITIVRKHFHELKKTPRHLAWCLMHYELLHRACRQAGYDTDNPKDIFLDYPDKDWKGLSEYELDLLYDAWAINVSNDMIIQDWLHLPEYKENMTVDDWIAMKCNPNYRYNSLYENREQVIDDLFTNSGDRWNKDGFLINVGCSRYIDEHIFKGHTLAENEIDPKIKSKIFDVVNNPKMKSSIKEFYDKFFKQNIEYNSLSGKDQIEYHETHDPRRIEDRKFREEILAKIAALDITLPAYVKPKIPKTTFYPFSRGYNRFDDMPDNAHPSYIKEGIKVARLIVSGQMPTFTGPANQDMIDVSQEFINRWEPKGY